MARDWDSNARELGRALSRYNGLTNSAKLDSITDVIASDLFEKRPFCYAYEVIKNFEKEVKPRSAEVHLHHAIAFGLLCRAKSGGTMSHPELASRLEATSHITLTPLGRALRAAVNLDGIIESDFKNFLWCYALLECDFDMYGLLIKMSEENDGNIVDLKKFDDKFYDLRRQQVEWMKKHFPHFATREQIQRNIQWIGRRIGRGKTGHKRTFVIDEIFRFDGKTPRHHFNQRKQWAKSVGHFSEKSLTKPGSWLASRLPPTADTPFFWLGPSKECAKSRIISAAEIPEDKCSPAWNLLLPKKEKTSPSNEMIDKTVFFIEESFIFVRLGSFEQASLDAVVPYVYFLQHSLGKRVDEHELFHTLLQGNRGKFACSLQPNLSQSHYRVKQVKTRTIFNDNSGNSSH